MISFIFYSALFSALLWFGFGRLKNVPVTISRRILLLFFLLKITAVPVFYLVYEKQYGGIENLDTGKFYHDVKIIAHADRGFFWKTLLGLQDDRPGTADYKQYLQQTRNWDNGTVKDYLYNDNRIVIRLHALLDIFTFDSYLAHALFNCIFSCIGIWWLFSAFQQHFKKKELLLLALLCFFPALWFYTGALLKEGLCLFLMGAQVKGLQQVSRKQLSGLLFLLPTLFLSLLLKPYLLLSFFLFSCLYFLLRPIQGFRKQLLIFLSLLILAFFGANLLSVQLKNRSLTEAALQHQKRFEAVSHGGVFLTDGYLYLQLPPDTNLIELEAGPSKKYRIRSGTPYIYWKPNRPADTLYAIASEHPSNSYELLYYLPPAGSNIQLNKNSGPRLVLSAFYHSLLQPFFYPLRGPLPLLASGENLLILIGLLVILFQFARNPKGRTFTMIYLTFALFITLLTGITAPNSGAIFRYRAPAVVFIPIAALLLCTRNAKQTENDGFFKES